jgi:hypothetical protein
MQAPEIWIVGISGGKLLQLPTQLSRFLPLSFRPAWPCLATRYGTRSWLKPMGLENRILGLACGFTVLDRLCCNLVLAGEPAQDRSAPHLIVGKVDR